MLMLLGGDSPFPFAPIRPYITQTESEGPWARRSMHIRLRGEKGTYASAGVDGGMAGHRPLSPGSLAGN